MISIQDLGLSILSDSPNKFYVIGGPEQGVKDKYIAKLAELYGAKYEYPSVADAINLMTTRHLIPLKPALYVIRYDESFVSSINETLADKIRKANIIGTIVCLYIEDKHLAKIDKYLPEYTSEIVSVNPKFIEKYLHSDFPHLDDRSIRVAAAAGKTYGHARNICNSMSHADPAELAKRSEIQLQTLFGCTDYCDEAQIRQAIAGKNFKALVYLTSTYNGPQDTLLYTILQTMIDMEKELTAKYHNSDLKGFIKYWTLEDTYYMFMHTYNELSKLRSGKSTDAEASLIYLYGILSFQRIPSVEVMQNGV